METVEAEEGLLNGTEQTSFLQRPSMDLNQMIADGEEPWTNAGKVTSKNKGIVISEKNTQISNTKYMGYGPVKRPREITDGFNKQKKKGKVTGRGNSLNRGKFSVDDFTVVWEVPIKESTTCYDDISPEVAQQPCREP